MIAGGVLLSAIMMVVVNNNLNLAAGEISSSEYASRVHNYLSTTIETNDGDWIIVGSNQYSGVPGNVGIGTTSPQAKLEVNGKIMMDDATAASDSANTVATKGYVDGKSSAQTWNASGSNQYSLVSGNIGIGTTNPTSKLTVNGTVNVSNNRITGLAAPVNDTDATTKAYVDAASGSTGGNTSVVFNSTLNVGMPLQGVIDYNSFTTSYYMNTIPLALPKANCGVKITACFAAPTKMVIGADPVARITKTPINAGGGAISASWSSYASSYYSGPQCGNDANGRLAYCPGPGYWCVGGQQCCPNTYPSGDGSWYCYPTNSTFPNIDTTNHVAYGNPRCSNAAAGETSVQYSLGENTCIYCPSDHPVYDPTSKNCIKDASVTTRAIGTACSTINTYLPTAFTDVTFLDASNAPLGAALIKVAYNCPAD